MKEKMKSGFKGQGYEAPWAESVAIAQEGILCASMDGVTTSDYNDEGTVEWGGAIGDGGGN